MPAGAISRIRKPGHRKPLQRYKKYSWNQPEPVKYGLMRLIATLLPCNFSGRSLAGLGAVQAYVLMVASFVWPGRSA